MKDYTAIENIEVNENGIILTKKRFWIVYSENFSMDNLIDWIDNPHLLMKKLNKYWNLSGWYIFDKLDRERHLWAIDKIWECATVHWDISYFKEIENKMFETNLLDIRTIDNKAYISIEIVKWIQTLAIANFTFIKKK
jgi:hypothetical protein